IERSADRLDRRDAFGAQQFGQLPLHHTQALLQAFAIHRVAKAHGAVQVVHHLEHFFEEVALVALDTVRGQSLLALAKVLHLGALAQIFVLIGGGFFTGRLQLCRQLGDAVRAVRRRRLACRSWLGCPSCPGCVLCLGRLFVSHVFHFFHAVLLHSL